MRNLSLHLSLTLSIIAIHSAAFADDMSRILNQTIQRGAQAQQQQYETAKQTLNSLENDPVMDFYGQRVPCDFFGKQFAQGMPRPGIFADRAIANYDPATIDQMTAVITKCASLAATLPPPRGPDRDLNNKLQQMESNLGMAGSWVAQLRSLYQNEVTRKQQMEAAEAGAAAQAKFQEEQKQAAAAAAERVQQEKAKRDAEARQSIFEADAALWKASYAQIKSVPWIVPLKAPSIGDDHDLVSTRERAVAKALKVVNTGVWQDLASHHGEVRDLPLMFDAGPMGHTLGSFMACVELSLAGDKIQFPVADGAVVLNPPILGNLGRYDVTITGAVGPGKKPLKWIMYLKPIGDHFYVDEVEENGDEMHGLPAIIMSSGMLLTTACSS